MNNDALLEIISNETKDSIDQISIVTPTVYTSIFAQFASKYNITLENEEEYSKLILDKEYSNLADLQAKTSSNALKLSNNTNRAIEAIKDKDEAILFEVLVETENLRTELEELKKSIYIDELTHTYNRKWLNDHFLKNDNKEINIDGVLCIIDLNYFKTINDSFGHIMGDKVLIFIANELKKTNYDVIRYGGDEFIIIFEDESSVEKIKKLLENIRSNIITKKIQAKDNLFKVSFSFGVCEFKQGDNISSIINEADKEMYKDKTEFKKKVTGI